MKKNYFIIITIMGIIIAALSTYIFIDSFKNDDDKVLCNIKDAQGITFGEITKISNKSSTERAYILVRQHNEEYILIYHDSDTEFKIGQEVKIIHDGVNYSNPPQTFGICLEIIGQQKQIEEKPF